MNDERGRRIGLNESVFREVNERLEEINETFAGMTQTMQIICECGDIRCAQMISIPAADYERLRSEPRHFAVVKGHEMPDVEFVVEENAGYDVVQKRSGEPARIAEETDPRSD